MAIHLPSAKWINRTEIDYLGASVKACFRYASALLRNNNAPTDMQSSRLAISYLQICLDAIHFEVKREGVTEKISLSNACIAPINRNHERLERKGLSFEASQFEAAEFKHLEGGL